MNINLLLKRSSNKFYLLLFLLSIPFWILGSMTGQLSKWLPINLPMSALMFICPLLASLILVYREDKYNSIKKLLKKTFDYKEIKKKIWYLPIIFLMPGIMLSSYGVMLLLGKLPPEPFIPVIEIPIFFVLFFFSAACEEIGWMGYIAEPTQARWNALKTGIFIGAVWGIWHAVPYFQAGNDLTWIIWQIFASILNRVLMVWIYNNTKSIFSTIIYHAMINVSAFLFPNYGSHYDPVITGVILIITTVIVIFLWGAKTLARYRYSDR